MTATSRVGVAVPAERGARSLEPVSRASAAQRQAFVGRESILLALGHALQSAQHALGTSLLIQGESGIGKSRLLQRFGQEIAGHGVQLLVGHGSAEPGAPALWPWIEVLQQMLRSRAELSEALLQAFAPWLPLRAAQQRTTSLPDCEKASQFMLQDMLVQAVLGAAECGTTCLMLEDLHEFDLASLRVLRHLQRQLTGRRVLVLASARPVEEIDERGQALAEVVAGFGERLSLSGLAEVEVQALMQRCLGLPVPRELAHAVHERADGNPLYVHAVITTVQSSDTGLQALSDVARLALPVSLQLAAQRQLDCLSAECRQVLRVAAVFGREVSLEQLAECVEARERVEPALREAYRHNVLRRQAAQPAAYRFAHALLHEVLLGELEPAPRAQAHARAAEALQRAAGSGHARVVCRVARHWLEVGDAPALARALQLAQQALIAARGRGAHAEAVLACEIALAAQRGLCAANSVEVGQRLIELGWAQWRCGQLTQALVHFEQAAQLAQDRGDVVLLAEAALGMLADFATVLSSERLALCELACERSTGCPRELRARLLAAMGTELAFRQPRARSQHMIEQALHLGSDCNAPEVQLALLQAQHHTWEDPLPLEPRRAVLERHALLATRLGDVAAAAWAESKLMYCALEFADAALVTTHKLRFEALAPRAGEPLISWVYAQDALLALLRGEWSKAEQALSQAEQQGRQIPNAALVVSALRVIILHWQGDVEGALALRQRMLERWDRPEVRAYLALHYLDVGSAAEARLELERALAGEVDSLFTRCRLAEAVHVLDVPSAAEPLFQELKRYPDRCALSAGGVSCTGAVARYAGLAALTAGHRKQGIELLRRAIAVNRSMSAMPYLALTQLELATALRADAPEQAAEHAREALQLAQALTMKPLIPRAEALCAELMRPQRAPSSTARQFMRRGDYWHLEYQGRSAYLADCKGMHYLEAMLADPGRPKHVLDLVAQVEGRPAQPRTAAPGELATRSLDGYERALDARSQSSYRARILELAEEATEAEAMNDLARQSRCRAELELLHRELRSGSKARHRSAERARKAVYNRVRDAIQQIERGHVELARHLIRSIKTGAQCVYRADDNLRWRTGHGE